MRSATSTSPKAWPGLEHRTAPPGGGGNTTGTALEEVDQCLSPRVCFSA